jgi:hypothetical protein
MREAVEQTASESPDGYPDAPTPYVNPRHHAILKRIETDVDKLSERANGGGASKLRALRGRVTLSTLPTGQINPRAILVPQTN